MVTSEMAERSEVSPPSAWQKLYALRPQPPLLGAVLGPFVGLIIWWLPLSLAPAAHKALAVAAFMLLYWVSKPIDYGMTALLGCFLFWASQAATFPVAFAGFAQPTPWFVFGGLLMGEAAARTGLAQRLGVLLLHRLRTSYSRLLLGLITLVWLLSFLIPTANALLATLVPIGQGLVAALGSPHSNRARGIFVILAYTSSLFGKMLLGGEVTVLAQGITEAQTGTRILWSQWFLAFLPAALLTIVASWLTIRWLYPVAHDELTRGPQPLDEALQVMGPWSRKEQRALLWLLLAIALWAMDGLHHLNPAMIGIGIGLLLVLPKVGVLDTQAVRQVNFLVVMFIGGALSLSQVLMESHAVDSIVDRLIAWLTPLLTTPWQAAGTLYWGNFLFRFLLGTELATVSTSLPILLNATEIQGYNPAAVSMIWAFAGGGKLFIYQSSVLVAGYAYGFFDHRDILKVGLVLTLFEGILLMGLVPLWWPLIGVPWQRVIPFVAP